MKERKESMTPSEEKAITDEKAQEEKAPYAVPFMTEKEVEERFVPNRAHTDM